MQLHVQCACGLNILIESGLDEQKGPVRGCYLGYLSSVAVAWLLVREKGKEGEEKL